MFRRVFFKITLNLYIYIYTRLEQTKIRNYTYKQGTFFFQLKINTFSRSHTQIYLLTIKHRMETGHGDSGDVLVRPQDFLCSQVMYRTFIF